MALRTYPASHRGEGGAMGTQLVSHGGEDGVIDPSLHLTEEKVGLWTQPASHREDRASENQPEGVNGHDHQASYTPKK